MSTGADTDAQGRLLVISGPSGSGKSTIIRTLRAHPRVRVSVSVTTRRARAGEVDHHDYHFVDDSTFRRYHAEGRFIETNDVFGNGNKYGSLRSELDQALAEAGLVYVMEVDVDGAHNIRAAGYEGTYVYIAPPSPDELARRLRGRATDDEAEIARRLGRAASEAEKAKKDGSHIVVNTTVEEAVDEILALVGLDPQPH